MILRILDKDGHEAGGIRVYENNFDGEVSVQETYHVEVVDDVKPGEDRDTIFGTNEEQVTIKIKPELLRVAIAKEIVNDIVSCREGQSYYPDEDLDFFVNNFLETETEYIRELVDEMMDAHLEDDNMTVRRQ